MLLIHAADLHLGKTLHERDLLEDQAAMLEGLISLLRERRPAALLLAGDLYDRAIPPPEAIALFDSFLSRALAELPGLVIAAIPGNHDSAARLSFAAGLLSRAGVHIRTRPADCVEPILLESGGEKLAIWALPFLGAGASLFPGDPGGLRSQAELFEAALGLIRPRLLPGAYNVLLAHCFATGGETSESERGFVGLAEQVDASLFEAFDYAALGHLHRPQKAGAKGHYPGSPLFYSFAEAWRAESLARAEGSARAGGAGRGFLCVELSEKGFRSELLPFEPLRRLVRIEGLYAELSAPGAHPELREDFVEARLLDPFPILDPAEALKANFPNLLSLRQAAFEIPAPGGGGESAGPSIGEREGPGGAPALLEDFTLFHREMRGAEPESETLALLGELAKEAESAPD